MFAAIGFLSKYLFIYLLISIDLLFFYAIFIKKYKKFDFKYLISLAVFIVLLVPHLIWLTNNDYITITYGFCAETAEPIGLKRLMARPIAELCIAAQEKHEKEEKVFADD